jgi:hypothetical protein
MMKIRKCNLSTRSICSKPVSKENIYIEAIVKRERHRSEEKRGKKKKKNLLGNDCCCSSRGKKRGKISMIQVVCTWEDVRDCSGL